MLENIHCPADLKKLNIGQKKALAAEIRETVLQTVSKTGGHLASNLGNVELTLAIHSVFDAPRDKIVYDVGHQSYVHKLLTGRYERFSTLRQKNGISGFTRRDESPYDAVCSGHASSSISLALGYARARDMRGEDNHVVAVLGDGALTGGMCYEALNDVGLKNTRLIVILNDNKMSISPNVGALSRYLTHMRQSSAYRGMKQKVRKFLSGMPKGGKPMERLLTRVKESIKRLLISDKFFGSLNIEYLGPIDGHNITEIERTLQSAKTYSKPVLIHVVTQKGKGYEPAEKESNKYHGVSPFDPAKGIAQENTAPTIGSLVGKHLSALAEKDPSIACISAAMLEGTGLKNFSEEHKDNCFDVGIAEEHAAAVAAGMALGGAKVYLALYATFLQRAYDQICIDIGLNRAPVTLLVDRCGLNGPDGETHQGIYDAGLLCQIPGMAVAVPADTADVYEMLELSHQNSRPMAIRYPKKLPANPTKKEFSIGQWEISEKGENTCILASGRMVSCALQVRNLLAERKIDCAVVNARFLKPMDTKMLTEILSEYEDIFTLEDNVKAGGLGEAIAAFASGVGAKVHILCVPDAFIPQGTVEQQMEMCGLDAGSVAEVIESIQEKNNGL